MLLREIYKKRTGRVAKYFSKYAVLLLYILNRYVAKIQKLDMRIAAPSDREDP